MKKWVDAISFATKSLEKKPEGNSKAHFRRATAYIEVGKFSEAKQDLKAAQEIDPESKSIKKLATKLAKAVAAHKALKKKKFGGFFSRMKGGMYDNKPNVIADPRGDPNNAHVS